MATMATFGLVIGTTFVWWRHWGPGHGDVAIVGDSITFVTTPAYESPWGLGFRYSLTISGQPGARADQQVAEAATLAASKPEQVVINLGTNDVLQRWATNQTLAALEQIGNEFAGARCIALVTISENIDKPEDPGIKDRTAALNAGIRDLAARHGWQTISWDAVVRNYLAAGEPDGPISTDTVHPTEVGQRMLVAATYESLDNC